MSWLRNTKIETRNAKRETHVTKCRSLRHKGSGSQQIQLAVQLVVVNAVRKAVSAATIIFTAISMIRFFMIFSG